MDLIEPRADQRGVTLFGSRQLRGEGLVAGRIDCEVELALSARLQSHDAGSRLRLG